MRATDVQLSKCVAFSWRHSIRASWTNLIYMPKIKLPIGATKLLREDCSYSALESRSYIHWALCNTHSNSKDVAYSCGRPNKWINMLIASVFYRHSALTIPHQKDAFNVSTTSMSLYARTSTLLTLSLTGGKWAFTRWISHNTLLIEIR